MLEIKLLEIDDENILMKYKFFQSKLNIYFFLFSLIEHEIIFVCVKDLENSVVLKKIAETRYIIFKITKILFQALEKLITSNICIFHKMLFNIMLFHEFIRSNLFFTFR